MRLFLCEKPSQGKDIARVLGATQPGSGCYSGLDVIVTWCVGHLLEQAPPERYGAEFQRWSLKHLPIIPNPWRLEVKSSTAAQFKTVQRLLGTAAQVIIATDADREGEMIAREVLEACGYRGPVLRLWLSALNDASIRSALAALKPGQATKPLYHAALARSRADWLIGMNLTRLFTLLGRRAGLSSMLTVGRVQTPTLQMVVDRDRAITSFVPVPYWVIDVQLTGGKGAGAAFRARWTAPQGSADQAGRCLREDVAQAAAQAFHRAALAQVSTVETQRVREPPPLPFDLATLQAECSARFGIDVAETLELAQELYERHKAITYPRTDSGYLPTSMLAEVPAVLEALIATDAALRLIIDTLDRTLRSRAWDDSQVGAHHGMIPTTEPGELSRLSEKERLVYQLIRARYLAQFLGAHEYDRTVAQLTCSGERLEARGKQVIVVGWRSLLREAREPNDDDGATCASQALPPLTSGTRCRVNAVDLRPLKTQAPKPYTQGELIKAMKGVARLVSDPKLQETLKNTTGIGTEATRASIIQGLIRRGYLRKSGRAVRASDMAHRLIDVLPAAIRDPATTAVWEQALERIAGGGMTLGAFVDAQTQWVTELVRTHAAAALTVPAAEVSSAPARSRQSRPRR